MEDKYSQTEETSLQCCESCFLTSKMLKMVGEVVDRCFVVVSAYKPLTPKLRDQQSNVFWGTQWAGVAKWCDALSQDCEALYKQTVEIVDKIECSETSLSNTKMLMNNQLLEHSSKIAKLYTQIDKFDVELSAEKTISAANCLRAETMEKNFQSLESLYKCSLEAVKSSTSQHDADLKNMDNAYVQLQHNKTEIQKTLHEVMLKLEEETKDKEQLAVTIVQLRETIQAQSENIKKKSNSLSEMPVVQDENRQLRQTIQLIKSELTASQEKAKVNDEAFKEQQLQFGSLQQKYEEALGKIEMLVLYPDLNGSFNNPSMEDESKDAVGTMEKQLESNEVRIRVLSEQTAKLKSAVQKLKTYLSQKST